MLNPFSYGSRLKDSSQFVNREEDISALYSFSSNNICCSLVGERRIGKSSLLRHISLSETLRRFSRPHRLVPSHYFFVLVDLQKIAGKSAEVFWRFLAQEIARTLTNRKGRTSTLKTIEALQAALLRPEPTFIVLEDFLSKLADNDIHLVILFDEFEYLTESTDFDHSFFGQLRSLADGQTLSYITASADSLLDLTYRDQSAIASPFFNIFTPITLGLFTHETARHLLYEPIRNQRSPFNDEEIEFLIDLAGPHPYFLKWAAFILFDQYQSLQKSSTIIHHQTIQKLFDERTFDQFRYYWNKLNLNERRILYEIACGESTSATSTPIIRKLIARSLVYEAAGNLRIFSSAFGRFVRSQELNESRKDLRGLPPGITEKLKILIVRFYQNEGYSFEEDAIPLKSKQVSPFEVVLRKQGILRHDYIFIDLEQHNVGEMTEFLKRVHISNSNSNFKFIYITPRSEINVHLSIKIQKLASPHNFKIWFREQLLTEFEAQPECKKELIVLLRTVADL